MSSDSLFNEAELKASLLTPISESEGEKTVAGRLIGAVRNEISGKPTNVTEARERSASNDMYAEVAADTMAMMPGLGYARAGVVRAGLLLNPNQSAQDNAMHFGLNFAEGVALHGVSKYGAKHFAANPGLSRSLMSESVGLFKFGFGMGAVKASFDEHTWLDKQGNLQVVDGIINVGKAGTVGGAIGIPAGMVASRVARYGATHLAESGLSPRALSIGLGTVSGYPAGAVFGGVDSAMRGGSFADVLKSAHEGGVVGAFTGGLTGGLIKLEGVPTPKRTEYGAATENLSTLQPERVVVARDGHGSIISPTGKSDSRFGRAHPTDAEMLPLELFPKMEFQARTNLAGNLQRLGKASSSTIEFRTAVDSAEAVANRSKTFGEFVSGALESHVAPARVYNVRGLEIALPENFAKELDTVYALRIAKERGSLPDASVTARANGEQAAKRLDLHPLKDMAHPADLLALDQLPDRSLVRRVEMFNHRNSEDPWHRKTYDPNFVSAATASQDGVIRYYKARHAADLAHITHHEWAHLLEFKATRESAAFGSAAALEKNAHFDRESPGYSVSKYSQRNDAENWAEHSATLTGADPTGFFITTRDAPLRTVVLGRALAKSLSFVPPGQRSEFYPQFAERISYINREVMPRAHQLMEHYLTAGTPAEQVHAAKLMREFGTEKHFEMLKQTAYSNKNDAVRDASFEAAREMAFYGRETWRGYNRAEGTAPMDSYVDFLYAMGKNGSRSRPQAMQYLEPLADRRAEGYYALLAAEDPTKGNAVTRLLEAMDKIPEQEAKELAYSHAQRIVKGAADKEFGLAIAVLQRVPALKEQALRSLIHIDVAKAEPILRDLEGKPLHPLHEVAMEGIYKLEGQQRMDALRQQLKNPNLSVREHAILALGRSNDNAALRPLLEAFGFGQNPAERILAHEMLTTHFNHQIVKQEIHALIRENPSWRPVLQPLLERRLPPGTLVDKRA